jgi:hypothetical protein
MKRRRSLFFIFPALLFLGLAALVMLLWNAILPDLLRVQHITYMQAIGLLLLSRILFGGFGFPGRGFRGGPPAHVRQRWMNMSEEERSKFKEEWKKRCEQKKSS